jgi:hypothetical protein
VTAGRFEVDGLGGLGVSAGLTYDLAVLAHDVDGVVGAAGGWLCDRARAGWQVTVVVPAGVDMRPLTILGVHAEVGESGAEYLRRHSPVALAVDARLLRQDDRLRRTVLGFVDDGRTEVTVWGEAPLFTADRRFRCVRHRLSAAARAFKQRALLGTKTLPAEPDSETGSEAFVSAALWYPLDGADLG